MPVNTFVPAALWTPPTPIRGEVSESQYAQERFLLSSQSLANPPFALTGSRNPLVENGGPILRGYIRRSDVDTADPTSRYRMYFMFNPDVIHRSYIAYLDQQALDPGNAIFGSGNMASAPGILDFSFDLMFDRAIEVARDENHPGTKVDYDYFDLVVRGVVPDSQDTGNAIPDNGIMMVSPSNVTVVFGEDLSVQGRPYNALVRWEKFSHRMIPTRMRIGIQMKAFYIGPIQTLPSFSQDYSRSVAEAVVPYDETFKVKAVAEEPRHAQDQGPALFTSAFGSAYTAGQNVTPGDTSGRTLTVNQAAGYAASAGFIYENLIHILCIAIRESGLKTDAIGDVGIQTGIWGPSVGLTQIRSLKDQFGTGGQRDQLANLDPAIHMQHAWEISAGGTNYSPWSTNAGWEQNRDRVETALRTGVG